MIGIKTVIVCIPKILSNWGFSERGEGKNPCHRLLGRSTKRRESGRRRSMKSSNRMSLTTDTMHTASILPIMPYFIQVLVDHAKTFG